VLVLLLVVVIVPGSCSCCSSIICCCIRALNCYLTLQVRGRRAKLVLCQSRTTGARANACRQWRARYRQYSGPHNAQYTVYDVTSPLSPSWASCYRQPCRYNCG